MNAGEAITAAMRAQRHHDLVVLAGRPRDRDLVLAYVWWGWAIHPDPLLPLHGHLGRPGFTP